MYVDNTYYTDSFGGTAIPSASFSMYERRARTFLDYITFNRLQADATLVTDKVKDCLCEIMECNYKIENDGGIKSSESVGNHSVAYIVNPNSTEYTKYYKIAKMYLSHTDLLYRGVVYDK